MNNALTAFNSSVTLQSDLAGGTADSPPEFYTKRLNQFQTVQNNAGFAAVDALVALTILATTVILTLGAAGVARRAALAAAEARRADQVLQAALLTAPHGAGAASGRVVGFDWRVVTTAGAGSMNQALLLCERSAEARSRVSGRIYRLATAELCAGPGS